jgi:hypothetical protein
VKVLFDPQMAANGFWQKVLPERHVRQLVSGEKQKSEIRSQKAEM